MDKTFARGYLPVALGPTLGVAIAALGTFKAETEAWEVAGFITESLTDPRTIIMRITTREQAWNLSQEMTAAFADATLDLFEITRPLEIFERKKGIYATLFAKPVKRIGRMLAAHRELLVLFSTFEDQQARTVRLAADIIDDSDGRLENSLAVIVHRDEAGNAKLKNWGRDLGLRVIPLYMPDLSIPRGQALERLLFSEFYSHDPFDVAGPVHDDSQFYGRRDEAQDLARQLQHGQIRSCLGIRKIGKTSLINRVLFVTREYHSCLSVMADCSKDMVWRMNAAQLLAAAAVAVRKASSDADSYAEVVEYDGDITVTAAYTDLMKAVRDAQTPTILFLDEVDYITPGSPTSAGTWQREFNTFWRNLRACFQELARGTTSLSLFVSGVSSKWFRAEAIDGVENAALSFVPEEYLSPLPLGASQAMIRDIGPTAGLMFDSETAESLADACSNMPFWIRKAASYVHRNVDVERRPLRVPKQTVESLVDAFIESEGAALAEIALAHLFRVYPELRVTAVACHRLEGLNQSPHLVGILERYGVVKRSRGGNPVVSGKMMREGMRHYLANLESRVEEGVPPTAETMRFDSISEWADELALLGATRNKIERRLRGIVLNFIRMDSLRNKQKGDAASRILKGIPSQRAAALEPVSIDEAMEKLYWAELTAAIEKNWDLFDPIFADRAAFKLHCNVVNLRPDAHAKEFDRAGVAEYRRSLQWLEQALSRV